jgi:hypothetical protein
MPLLLPPEAIYPDPDTAFAAIQVYAKDQGYTFKKDSNRSNKRVYSCDRAGKYDPRGKDPAVHKSKQRMSTGSKKCRYLIIVELQLDYTSGTWMLQVLQAVYNHVIHPKKDYHR